MKSFSTFIHMGGYAVCVWSAYGMALSILAGNVILSIKNRKKTLKRLREYNKENKSNL